MRVFFIFLIFLVSAPLFGATCTTTSTTTWDCGTPGQNDDLIVNHDITISGNFTVNNGSITVNAPYTLTFTGNLEFNNNSEVLVNNGATIHVMGNFLNKNNSGDVEIFGSLIVEGDFQNGQGSGQGAIIDVGGTGTITYGGSCSNPGTVVDDDGSYIDDCDNPILPVELINFRGTATEFGNLIQWETASERNNDFFMLERSISAQNWEAIATIEGHGNSDQIINYQYTDIRPLPGRVFYRLKQVDFDGGYEYSYIISVITGELPQFQVQAVYPNPSNGKIQAWYISNNQSPVYYQLINDLGQSVSYGVKSNIFGSSILELNLPPPTGIYLLILRNKNLTVTRKIIRSD